MPHRFSSALAAAGAFAFGSVAMAEDTTFVVTNTNETDVAEIYAYPSHLSDGPGEPLPQSSVPAGTSVTFTIADGFCAYELWFVFVNGHRFHDTADFCEFGTYVVK